MAKPLIPFVKNGYYASMNWTPLVNGNGLTAGGGDEPEPDPTWETVTGNPVSFSTLTAYPLKSLSLSMSPIQSLNGYSNPWPAGGNINKLPVSEAFTDTINGITFKSDGNGVYTISGTASAAAQKDIDLVVPYTFPAENMYLHINNPVGNGSIIVVLRDANGTQLINRSAANANQISGAISQEGKAATQLRLYVSNGTAISGTFTLSPALLSTITATSFTPWANICPISGWDGVDVTRTGKNLFDISSFPLKEGYYINRTIGSLAGNANFDCTEGYIPVTAFRGQTLKWNCDDHGGSNPGLAFYRSASESAGSYISGARVFPVEVPAEANYLRFTVKHGQTDIMLYIGDAPSAYEPYSGTTISISIPTPPGTVYSGTLDVVTGVLTVDKGIIDLGTLTWTYDSTSYAYGYFTSTSQITARTAGKLTGLCSAYKVNQGGRYSMGGANSQITGYNETNSKAVCVRDDRYTDPTDFKTAVNGTTLTFDLATPAAYQLTPQEVSSLLGQNVVWTDGDSVTVEYRSN